MTFREGKQQQTVGWSVDHDFPLLKCSKSGGIDPQTKPCDQSGIGVWCFQPKCSWSIMQSSEADVSWEVSVKRTPVVEIGFIPQPDMVHAIVHAIWNTNFGDFWMGETSRFLGYVNVHVMCHCQVNTPGILMIFLPRAFVFFKTTFLDGFLLCCWTLSCACVCFILYDIICEYAFHYVGWGWVGLGWDVSIRFNLIPMLMLRWWWDWWYDMVMMFCRKMRFRSLVHGQSSSWLSPIGAFVTATVARSRPLRSCGTHARFKMRSSEQQKCGKPSTFFLYVCRYHVRTLRQICLSKLPNWLNWLKIIYAEQKNMRCSVGATLLVPLIWTLKAKLRENYCKTPRLNTSSWPSFRSVNCYNFP